MTHTTAHLHATRLRLANHYAQRLHEADAVFQGSGERVEHVLNQLRLDWEQIRQWQAWSSAHATESRDAAMICSAFPQAGTEILQIQLNQRERLEWLLPALVAARWLADRPAELVHLIALSRTYDLLGDYEQAEQMAQQAYELAVQLDNQLLAADSLHFLGVVTVKTAQYRKGQQYHERSLAIYQQLGDQRRIAESLHNLGMVARHYSDMQAAANYYRQSMACFQAIGNREGIANNLHDLGLLAFRAGEYDSAWQQLEQSLAMYQSLGHVVLIPYNLCNMGVVAVAQGQDAIAKQAFEQSLKLFRAAENLQGAAYALEHLGILLLNQHAWADANQRLLESYQIYRKINAPRGLVIVLCSLAQLAIERTDWPTARLQLYEALQIACRVDVITLKAAVLLCAARIWQCRNLFSGAVEWLGSLSEHCEPSHQQLDKVQRIGAELGEIIGAAAYQSAFTDGQSQTLASTLVRLEQALAE